MPLIPLAFYTKRFNLDSPYTKSQIYKCDIGYEEVPFQTDNEYMNFCSLQIFRLLWIFYFLSVDKNYDAKELIA